MKSLLLILFLLVSSPIAKAQVASQSNPLAFTMSSVNTGFGLQGEFEGKYRIYPDRVEVWFTKADIAASKDCPYQGRRLLTALKIGLATNTENKAWKIAYPSEQFAVGQVISIGETHQLGEFELTIPLNDKIDLSRYWLVVQLEANALDLPEASGRIGYYYAHSRCDIFAKCDRNPNLQPDPLIH